MRAWLSFGESSLPGLQLATFLLCPHVGSGRGVGLANFLASSYKALTHHEGSTLTGTPPKGPTSSCYHIGIRVSTCEFGGDTNIQSIALVRHTYGKEDC